MSSNPLAQFEIRSIFSIPTEYGVNLDFTNSSLYMVIALVAVSLFMAVGIFSKEVIPGYWQAAVESLYKFVRNTIVNSAGEDGLRHFVFIFTLFTFVMFCNLLGMIPGGFTVTSHVAVTFLLAIIVFIYVNIVAFGRYGIKYFKMFLPAGTPWWLAPLMIFIEIFAYLARPFSLAIRLAANMMAGHTMLKIMASFVLSMNVFLAVLPFAFVVVLIGFELFVALLQAYIFAVLTCVYLNDALHMH